MIIIRRQSREIFESGIKPDIEEQKINHSRGLFMLGDALNFSIISISILPPWVICSAEQDARGQNVINWASEVESGFF